MTTHASNLNQRELARQLAISQGAVSLALRGDPSVSRHLQERVQELARKLHYRPNPYVSTLMTHIRSARSPKRGGVIALVVDRFSERAWKTHASYRVYYRGVRRAAEELGFSIECFFLSAGGLTAARVDQILRARGIRGLILAPPYFGNRGLQMTWENYACVGTGYAWEQQQFDRVAHDHAQNAWLAFRTLRERNYQRIGLVLPAFYAQGRGTRWLDGFLVAQHDIPEKQRLPLFVGAPEEDSFRAFKTWFNRWRPDSLLTLYGKEAVWLEALGLEVPKEVGLACLIRPAGDFHAGIEDRYDEIGAAAVQLVASKIGFNQFGVPASSRLLLIDGYWVDGVSARGTRDATEPSLQPAAPAGSS